MSVSSCSRDACQAATPTHPFGGPPHDKAVLHSKAYFQADSRKGKTGNTKKMIEITEKTAKILKAKLRQTRCDPKENMAEQEMKTALKTIK